MFEIEGYCAGLSQSGCVAASYLGELPLPSCDAQPSFRVALEGALLQICSEALGVLGELLGDLQGVESELGVLADEGRRLLFAHVGNAVAFIGRDVASVGDPIASVCDLVASVSLDFAFIGETVALVRDAVAVVGPGSLAFCRRAGPFLRGGDPSASCLGASASCDGPLRGCTTECVLLPRLVAVSFGEIRSVVLVEEPRGLVMDHGSLPVCLSRTLVCRDPPGSMLLAGVAIHRGPRYIRSPIHLGRQGAYVVVRRTPDGFVDCGLAEALEEFDAADESPGPCCRFHMVEQHRTKCARAG